MASQAQVFANTENAQNSTGPKTESGKSIARLNAFRHGLTAQTLVFSPEEEIAYAQFSMALLPTLGAQGAYEAHLAEELVVTYWRLKRVPILEANLIAQTTLEPAPPYLAEIENPEVRAALLESTALIVHEKQLRNLHLQEQRLRRHAALLLGQLADLQTARQNGTLDPVPAAYPAPATCDTPAPTSSAAESTQDPASEPIGFVFANPQSSPVPAPENAPHERDQLRKRPYSNPRTQHAHSTL